MRFKSRHPLLTYGVAIATTGIALFLSLWFQPFISKTIGAFFYIAIIFSTWYGGIRPGIVAIILSTLAIDYFLIPPIYQMTISAPSDLVRLSVFSLVAIVINLLSSDLQRSQRQVEQLNQQLLQESGDRLKMALSAAQMGMWDWNAVTGEIVWSPEHEQLFDFAPGTFDGRYETFVDCVHPDDREGVTQAVQFAMQNHTLYQHEYRIVWKDGSVHWLEGRGQALYDKSGQVVRMSGTIMNIDQRKQMETALMQSEQQLRAIFEAEPECVKIITADGILQTMNPAGLDMIEVDSLEQAVGQYVCPFIKPAYRQAFLAFTQQVAQGKSGKLEFEIVGLRGTQRWLESHAVPLQLLGESATHVLAVTRDISDRKRAEAELRQLNADLEQRVAQRTTELSKANDRLQAELLQRQRMERALQESELKFRSAFEYAAIGMALVGIDGHWLQVNRAVCDLVGYTEQELLASDFQTITHPDDLNTDLTYAQQLLADEIPTYQLEKRYIHKQGHLVWVLLSVSLVRDDQHQPLYFISQIQNISDRKQTEARLADELGRSRAIFKASFDGIVVINQQGDVVEASASFAHMLGYTLEEAVKLHVSDWDAQWTKEELIQIIQESKFVTAPFETRHRRKDGSMYEVEISVSNVDVRNEILQVCICRDISDRKRAELALRESEQRLNLALEGAGDGLWDWNISTEEVYLSPRWLTMLDYAPDELPGSLNTWEQLIHPDDKPWVLETLDAHLRDQSAPYKFDYRLRTKSGKWKWIANYGRVTQRDENGSPIRMTGTHRDISDRKRAELALQASEAKFRILTESSPIGVFMADTTGSMVYTNPRAHEIGGYSFEEALGDGWTRFIHPNDLQTIGSNWTREVLEQKWRVYEGIRYIAPDGTVRRYGRIQVVPILAADGSLTAYMGTIEDITHQLEVDQMKAEFISIVSHELRTPLTSMQAALNLLVEKIIDPTSEEGETIIQVASNGVDRLVRLVSDILDLERLESGKIRLEKRFCNTADLIAVAVDQMQEMANQAQVTLNFTPNAFQIYADLDRLLQVLINLLSNAIKFSQPGDTVWLTVESRNGEAEGEGGEGDGEGQEESSQEPEARSQEEGKEWMSERVSESPSTHLPTHPPTHPPTYPPTPSPSTPYILFSVKDRGRGIPAEHLETIFERFQQVDTSDSREKGGTGLGLAICRSIIQQHGGQIWGESSLNQGSTFWFTVPIREGMGDGD